MEAIRETNAEYENDELKEQLSTLNQENEQDNPGLFDKLDKEQDEEDLS